MAGGGGGEGEPEFQVAPMIDVLLTILVFFMMITSAQVLKVDKSIQLPVGADALKKETQREEAVINVAWKNEKADFSLEEKHYKNPAEMVPILKQLKAAGDKKIVGSAPLPFRAVIRGDKDAPALHIARAMNAAGEAGISDITFSAVSKEGQ
jgi:biopolymer transport protein ExbD